MTVMLEEFRENRLRDARDRESRERVLALRAAAGAPTEREAKRAAWKRHAEWLAEMEAKREGWRRELERDPNKALEWDREFRRDAELSRQRLLAAINGG